MPRQNHPHEHGRYKGPCAWRNGPRDLQRPLAVPYCVGVGTGIRHRPAKGVQRLNARHRFMIQAWFLKPAPDVSFHLHKFQARIRCRSGLGGSRVYSHGGLIPFSVPVFGNVRYSKPRLNHALRPFGVAIVYRISDTPQR